MVSNFTRVVMVIWVFVVLILTSSYTASLTSMLTVQQLNIDRSRLKVYQTDEVYDEALTKGSSRGGVGAIIDEIPYIKVFLSKYCGKYTMVGNIYRTDGFGFVSTTPSLSLCAQLLAVSYKSRCFLKARRSLIYRERS